MAGRQPLLLRQVHSDIIVESSNWQVGATGDGIIVREVKHAAVIQTADCLPLFFYRPAGGLAGILHLGWRGLRQGIEKRLLERVRQQGGDIRELRFFIGPAIEQSCYEVGEDLVRRFQGKAYFPYLFKPAGNSRYRMDLKNGVRASLQAGGVGEGQIADCRLCTFCLPQRFPSFRRDGPGCGRIYNFIYWRD